MYEKSHFFSLSFFCVNDKSLDNAHCFEKNLRRKIIDTALGGFEFLVQHEK